VTLPGASTVWSAYGGTSIAAPQWAGLVAVANAIRAASSKAALGDVHTALYKSIAAVPGTYAASLHDVVEGTNGTCATCRAGTGYDQATGWGSPNASQLFQALAGASTTTAATTTGTSTNTAPTVTAATLSEKAGAYFATRVAARDADGDALSYTMSGAPSGLTLAGNMLSGTVSTKGTYRVTVTAHDTHGATGSAVITLVVA